MYYCVDVFCSLNVFLLSNWKIEHTFCVIHIYMDFCRIFEDRSSADSVGLSSLNSLQILIPFINVHIWVPGWQKCRNPNFSPLYFSMICNTTSNHTLCKRNFLIQILGRWFQRFRWFQKFRIFESGFCPFCVRFLPSAPTNERTHVVQKRALA